MRCALLPAVALSFLLAGCASPATPRGGPSNSPRSSTAKPLTGSVLKRTITVRGQDGTTLRMSLRGESAAELNARESAIRNAAASRSLANPILRLTFQSEIFNQVTKYGPLTRRAAIEQLTVLQRDVMGPFAVEGLNQTISEADGTAVAETGMLRRNGALVAAYRHNGEIHYVE